MLQRLVSAAPRGLMALIGMDTQDTYMMMMTAPSGHTAGASSKRLHTPPSPAAPSALCALHPALPAPQLRAAYGYDEGFEEKLDHQFIYLFICWA